MKKTLLILGSISTFMYAACDAWELQYHPENCFEDELGDTAARQLIQDNTILNSVIRSETNNIPESGAPKGSQGGIGMIYGGDVTLIEIPLSHAISHDMRVKANLPIVKNDITKESGLGDVLVGMTKHYGSTKEQYGHIIAEARATLPTGNEENFLGAGTTSITLAGSSKKDMNDFYILSNASLTLFLQDSSEYNINYGETFLLMGGIERDCIFVNNSTSRAKLVYTSKQSDSYDGASFNNESTALDAYLSWSSSQWVPNYPLEAGFRLTLIHDEGKNTEDNRGILLFVNTLMGL